MTRSDQIIRLLASVVIAIAACTFVAVYDSMSTVRYQFDHPNADGHWTEQREFVLDHLLSGAEFTTTRHAYAYAIPVAGLLIGALFMWRWQQFPALIEVVIAAMWIFAAVWAAYVLLAWEAQNIPMYHGNRWHY